MRSSSILRSPQVAALIALGVSLVAIVLVPKVLYLGPDSTYDATSSLTIFRNATILTIVFFGLSFLTRWLVIPGMLTALFGSLAIATYLLGPGRENAILLGIAVLGLLFAVWQGISILRRPRKAS